MLTAIAEEQAKDGANVILDASDGCGSLHLGGFMASGLKYVELHHITHVVNAAKGKCPLLDIRRLNFQLTHQSCRFGELLCCMGKAAAEGGGERR